MSRERYLSLTTALFLAILVALSTPARADDLTKSFAPSGVKSVLIESSLGNVTVNALEHGEATVVAHKIAFDSGCELTIEQVGAELRATSKEPKGLVKKCEVNFELAVPKNATVKLRVGKGNATLAGLSGDILTEIGAGDLAATKVQLKSLDGKTGAGNVKVDEIGRAHV